MLNSVKCLFFHEGKEIEGLWWLARNVGHEKALLLIMENIASCLYTYGNDTVGSEKQRWDKQQFQEQKQIRRKGCYAQGEDLVLAGRRESYILW